MMILSEQSLSVFDGMNRWLERGWLSQLNRAFARFLFDQDAQADGAVFWAGALLSRQLDRGEVYLDLQKLCSNPGLTLGLPNEAAWQAGQLVSPDDWQPVVDYCLTDWQTVLGNSVLVTSGAGNTPMVLDGCRLYLRRYWHYQQTVNNGIQQRLAPIRDCLPIGLLQPLQTLFDSSPEQPDWQKIACVLALRCRFSIITGGPGTGKTTTLTKLLALLITLHDLEQVSDNPRKLTILLAAPTGKAAARVSESIGKAVEQLAVADAIKQDLPKKASTLHRLLGSRHDTRQFAYHRNNPLVADMVIVDEASMIDLEMMACLLDALPPTAHLILLGDKDQLASVEAGAVMGDLCHGAEHSAYNKATVQWLKHYAGDKLPTSSTGSAINQQTIMLRYSHRFNEHSGIGQLAKAVNNGDVALARSILNDTARYADLLPLPAPAYLKHRSNPQSESANKLLKTLVLVNGDDVHGGKPIARGYAFYRDIIQRQRPTDSGQYQVWAKQVLQAFDTFQVLCALRQGPWGVAGLNQRIADWLLPQRKPGLWYEGRPVMVTRNDYNLGLMNGDIGITLQDASGKLKVVFPQDNPLADGSLRWLSPMRLPEVATAFAITVHKSQGSEFNHVLLALPEHTSPVLTRELVYTGITRAKENFTLLESKAGVLGQAILSTCK